MINFKRFYISLLFSTLFMVYTPVIQADMNQQTYGHESGGNRTYTYATTDSTLKQSSYREKVGDKTANAFANLISSPLELPKNIINTMNQSNFFYGVFGGFTKGLVNTLGRAGCGITDLITFPIPTRPIAYPVYIWDDFDIDTTYGPVFRLDKTQKTDQPQVTQTPVTHAEPTPVAVPPRTAVVNRSYQYNQQTSRNLDARFKQEMQK